MSGEAEDAEHCVRHIYLFL